MGGQILEYEGKTIFNEGKKESRKEGRQEGINEDRQRMATDMLKDGEPLEKIIRYSKLAKDAVLDLAHSIEISIVK